MPVSDSKVGSNKAKKAKKGPSGNNVNKSSSPPVKSPEGPPPPEETEDVEEEEDYNEMEEEMMEGDEGSQWGEGTEVNFGDPDEFGEEQEEEEEEVEVEDESNDKPAEHIFMCHEIIPRKSIDFTGKKDPQAYKNNKQQQQGSFDGASFDADGELLGPSQYGLRYRMLNPEDMEYRPAALAEINSKIAEFDTKKMHIVARLQVQANAQLSQYGCHRMITTDHQSSYSNYNNSIRNSKRSLNKKTVAQLGGDFRASGDEQGRFIPKEGMDKLLNRLKIYKRVLSTLVIYFRAYAPLLFDIKKSYDDMLNFRIRQFKAAQYEKLRIYHDVSLVYTKMKEYQFPDYDKLLKGQQYLNLLMVRIHKQDDAIMCMTEYLRKMERALADHYEAERDLLEQIRMLDQERRERMEKAAAAMKKFEVPVEDEENEKRAEDELTAGLEMTEGEEDEEDLRLINMKMNDDQKMACILAYAVCLKDLEEAQKKLKIYETRYMNVAPRHEVETLKIKIQEERDSTVELNQETEKLDGDLLALRDEEVLIQQDLETYRRMPDDERLRSVKARFLREQRELAGDEEEDGEEYDSEEEDEDEEEGDEHEGGDTEEGNNDA